MGPPDFADPAGDPADLTARGKAIDAYATLLTTQRAEAAKIERSLADHWRDTETGAEFQAAAGAAGANLTQQAGKLRGIAAALTGLAPALERYFATVAQLRRDAQAIHEATATALSRQQPPPDDIERAYAISTHDAYAGLIRRYETAKADYDRAAKSAAASIDQSLASPGSSPKPYTAGLFDGQWRPK